MILKFLNLLDLDEKLSLINLCIYAMLVKCLIFQVDIWDAVIFSSLIIGYCHKRVEERLALSKSDLEKRVTEASTRIRELAYDLQKYEEIAARMEKQSNEVQKIITGKTFERAFNPTGRML